MRITLDANPSDAPCCVKIIAEDGRDILIQTDWEWPGIATTFGWSVSDVPPNTTRATCDHDGTDGTIDCPCCGLRAGAFIQAARQFLDRNDGESTVDPGYFHP